MNDRRIKAVLAILIVAIIATAITMLVLRSYDQAIALFVVGFAMVLLFIEPFVGLLVYLAYFYIRPHEFIPALEGSRLMLMIGGATFGSMLVREIVRRKGVSFFRSPNDWLMWWFFAAILVSHLSHADISGATTAANGFLNVIVIYFLITNLVNTEKRVRLFILVLVLSSLLLAVQGIIQYYFGVGLAGQTVTKDHRIQSLAGFGSANALAMALLVALPFVFFEMRNTKKAAVRIATGIASATLVFAIYLTNSRGTMLSLGAMAMVYVVRRAGWLKGIVAGGVFFVIITLLGPSRMSDISPTEESAFGRILAWDVGFQMIQSNPVFGIGAEAWERKYHSLVAHNSFIHCAAEVGLFGLLAWVLLIFVSMRNVEFISRHPLENAGKDLNSYAEKLFYAGLAYVFTMIFISKTYNPLLFVVLALSAALTRVYVDQSDQSYVLFDRKDLLWGVVISVVGLIGFKIFVAWVGV